MELKHYTSLDTLYKILESKKMRFSSLKNVDDKEEQWTADLANHGKHIFVCCFNGDTGENLGLWNMHKMNEEGIMIQFKENVSIFNKFSYLGKKEGKNYTVSLDNTLSKIEYTDDEEKLFPIVYKDSPNRGFGIYLPLIGKCKSTGWAFENEYRYRIIVYNYFEVNGDMQCEIDTLPFEYYDVPINKVALANMLIIIGRNVDEENKNKLINYINNYNIKNNTRIKVKESYYTNRIND